MSTPVDPATVWDRLRTIPDPEFGINIVDLGLIYDVSCTERQVAVIMTLTTAACPSGGWIYQGVKQALAGLPGDPAVDVQLVFEPPWAPAMLSAAARAQLGWEPGDPS